MSGVHPFPRRGPADEPAVTHPALAEIVRLARAQQVARVKVTAQDVTTVWKQSRRRSAWTLLAMGAAAAGLVGAFMTMGPGPNPDSSTQERVAVASELATAPVGPNAGVPGPAEVEDLTAVQRPADEREATPASPRFAERLPQGVQVRPVDAGSHPRAPDAVIVHSQWAVEVAAGAYEVVVPADAPRSLEVTVYKRVLEVEPGSTVSVMADEEPSFEIHRGRAAWRGDGGRSKAGATAAELARRADHLMAAGDDAQAAVTLRELIRRFPTGAPAKAATLDLARLERSAGHDEAARCAYQSYLERWPQSPLGPDVERNLAALGGPRACRGLRPR